MKTTLLIFMPIILAGIIIYVYLRREQDKIIPKDKYNKAWDEFYNKRQYKTKHTTQLLGDKSIKYAQIFASICLGISCFLPFCASGEVEYLNSEWFLFFWAIPAVIITRILYNRWLKTIFCAFFSIPGLYSLLFFTFLANFKSRPLIGFHIASASIIILISCWIALIVITLMDPQ